MALELCFLVVNGALTLRKELTQHQQKVYGFIYDEVRLNSSVPTYSAISKKFENSSANSGAETIKQLIKKGWLQRREDNIRASYRLANVKITIEDFPSD